MAETLHTCDYNGHVNKVIAYGDSVILEYCYKGSLVTDAFEYSREEAIAAAKAILAWAGEE